MYIVKKPLKIDGKRLLVGERVGEVSNVGTLLNEGYLVEAPDMPSEACEPERVAIYLLSSDISLEMDMGSLQESLRILQMTAEEAVGEIGQLEDTDILSLLEACDHRKKVISAIKSRAKTLAEKVAVEE